MRTILARADAGTAAHGGIIPGCPGQRQLHQPDCSERIFLRRTDAQPRRKKYRLGELSGLRVPIEFNVTIKANPKGLKPIKVEDRLRYLTDKNPLLTKLRKELELDVE